MQNSSTTKFTDNQFLNRHRMDVASQFGEDGIIEKIFEILPPEIQDHWACEFGAWDGKHCSNTYNLVKNRSWKAVLIEANGEKFNDLKRTYDTIDRVVLLNKFVGLRGKDILDDLLRATPIPINFDLLSIDVDSVDYHIWESVVQYRPKVVLIEFNPTIPDNIEFVQDANPAKKHGSSLLSMTKLASQKGYELICVNAENAFYIDAIYFPLFRIKDNSLGALKYYREPLQVFQLFDGTLVFEGKPGPSLIWYSLPVNFNRLQILPRFIRDAGIPWGGNRLLGAILKCIRIYRRRFWRNVDSDPGKWKM